MKSESKKLLYDVLIACRQITEFNENKTFEEYSDNELLRAGTERKFEIVGEALRLCSGQAGNVSKWGEEKRFSQKATEENKDGWLFLISGSPFICGGILRSCYVELT